MKNRVTVTIAGSEYTILASESEEYIEKVAEVVDQRMTEIMQAGKVSAMNAAVLAAVNICDEGFKSRQNAENMRSQLKAYVADASRAKVELSEANREIERLRSELAKARAAK